jgi:hypothetical protein
VLSATALIVAVLAWQVPAIAQSVVGFARNADKVDNRHANQIVRATTKANENEIDNFDVDVFTEILSKRVKAPTKGILVVWGTVAAVRDVDYTPPAVLNARVRVGSNATTTQMVYLEYSGSEEGSVAISGAIPVSKGTKKVILEAYESEASGAFIVSRSITTLFVPFGNKGKVGALGRPILQDSATASTNG